MKRMTAHHALCVLTSPWGDCDAGTLSPVDWDAVIAVANSHYLVPALYCALRDKSLLHLPPEMAVAYAQEVYSLNVKRNRNLSKQLEGVVRCLNAVEIEPILIKGAASLVEKWVPDSAARFMFDLDILVPKDKGERALNALHNEGYAVPMENQQPVLEDGQHHYPSLQKRGEPALVELHIRALSQKCRAVVTAETLLHKAKRISLGVEASAWLPEPTEQLLLMFLHSEISHENHQLALLDMRHAWDVPWFCTYHGNAVAWEEIEERVSVAGYQGELAGYLRLLNGFFSMPVPPVVQKCNSDAELHYRRVRSLLTGERANLILLQQFLKNLQFTFSQERIEQRYGEGRGLRLQLNRIRYLLYLLYKYRKQSSWFRLIHSYRLRMRDNAGR